MVHVTPAATAACATAMLRLLDNNDLLLFLFFCFEDKNFFIFHVAQLSCWRQNIASIIQPRWLSIKLMLSNNLT